MKTSSQDSSDNSVLTQAWFVIVTHSGTARLFALL